MDKFPLPMLNAFIGKKLLKLLGFIGKKVVTLQPKQWKKVADILVLEDKAKNLSHIEFMLVLVHNYFRFSNFVTLCFKTFEI